MGFKKLRIPSKIRRDRNVSLWNLEESLTSQEHVAGSGSRLLIGNGYMGVRGTLEEYKKEELPAINLSGIYDRYGDGWREPLNAPNALFCELKEHGDSYHTLTREPKRHMQGLDYRHGIFYRETLWENAMGEILVKSRRIASMDEVHLLAMEYEIEASYDTTIVLCSGIDGDVWDIHGPHYDSILFSYAGEHLMADALTHEAKEHVYVVQRVLFSDQSENPVLWRKGERSCLGDYRIHLKKNEKIKFWKWIGIYTSKDEIEESLDAIKAAEELTERHKKAGFENTLQRHLAIWENLWEESQVEIDGDETANERVNYSLYHLHSIAPRHSKSLSIPARGLSGQTYKGAVFWDTEMFILDFFLYTEPEVAKTLIRYRLDTLDGAIVKAREYGLDGAFYAWESQEGGFDACSDYNVTDVFTKRPMRTFFRDKQVHISAAVIYALQKYMLATGDEKILEEGGARAILECAKFYYSLLLKKAGHNLYEIHDVIGPDEYHERVNNNGYTNRMAKFCFELAVDVIGRVQFMDEHVRKQLNKEYNLDILKVKFEDAMQNIYIPGPNQDGVVPQFDGYFELEDTTPTDLKTRLLHEKEYWGGAYGVASHTQVIKQADVITWINMFPKDFNTKIVEENWKYYEPRTEHGSSLSASMYAMVACRCDMEDKAYPFFLKTASSDFVGGGKEWAGLVYIGGTHPAASGGAYMTVVYGFAGLTIEEGEIRVRPKLPKNWNGLSFPFKFQNKKFRIQVRRQPDPEDYLITVKEI